MHCCAQFALEGACCNLCKVLLLPSHDLACLLYGSWYGGKKQRNRRYDRFAIG
jgi:hypothetical protein